MTGMVQLKEHHSRQQRAQLSVIRSRIRRDVRALHEEFRQKLATMVVSNAASMVLIVVVLQEGDEKKRSHTDIEIARACYEAAYTPAPGATPAKTKKGTSSKKALLRSAVLLPFSLKSLP